LRRRVFILGSDEEALVRSSIILRSFISEEIFWILSILLSSSSSGFLTFFLPIRLKFRIMDFIGLTENISRFQFRGFRR
jgi:hypothetical protein